MIKVLCALAALVILPNGAHGFACARKTNGEESNEACRSAGQGDSCCGAPGSIEGVCFTSDDHNDPEYKYCKHNTASNTYTVEAAKQEGEACNDLLPFVSASRGSCADNQGCCQPRTQGSDGSNPAGVCINRQKTFCTDEGQVESKKENGAECHGYNGCLGSCCHGASSQEGVCYNHWGVDGRRYPKYCTSTGELAPLIVAGGSCAQDQHCESYSCCQDTSGDYPYPSGTCVEVQNNKETFCDSSGAMVDKKGDGEACQNYEQCKGECCQDYENHTAPGTCYNADAVADPSGHHTSQMCNEGKVTQKVGDGEACDSYEACKSSMCCQRTQADGSAPLKGICWTQQRGTFCDQTSGEIGTAKENGAACTDDRQCKNEGCCEGKCFDRDEQQCTKDGLAERGKLGATCNTDMWNSCGDGLGCCGEQKCFNRQTSYCGQEGKAVAKKKNGEVCNLDLRDQDGRMIEDECLEGGCCGNKCFNQDLSYCDDEGKTAAKKNVGESCTDDECKDRCCDGKCYDSMSLVDAKLCVYEEGTSKIYDVNRIMLFFPEDKMGIADHIENMAEVRADFEAIISAVLGSEVKVADVDDETEKVISVTFATADGKRVVVDDAFLAKFVELLSKSKLGLEFNTVEVLTFNPKKWWEDFFEVSSGVMECQTKCEAEDDEIQADIKSCAGMEELLDSKTCMSKCYSDDAFMLNLARAGKYGIVKWWDSTCSALVAKRTGAKTETKVGFTLKGIKLEGGKLSKELILAIRAALAAATGASIDDVGEVTATEAADGSVSLAATVTGDHAATDTEKLLAALKADPSVAGEGGTIEVENVETVVEVVESEVPGEGNDGNVASKAEGTALVASALLASTFAAALR